MFGSYAPINVEELTKTCYPGNIGPARKLAGEINSALSTTASIIGHTPEIQALRAKLFAHLKQHSSGGCGCTNPNDRQMCEGILKSVNAIAVPTITPEEEIEILNMTLPPPPIEASFLRRNFKPVIIGGSVLVLGALGMIFLIKS